MILVFSRRDRKQFPFVYLTREDPTCCCDLSPDSGNPDPRGNLESTTPSLTVLFAVSRFEIMRRIVASNARVVACRGMPACGHGIMAAGSYHVIPQGEPARVGPLWAGGSCGYLPYWVSVLSCHLHFPSPVIHHHIYLSLKVQPSRYFKVEPRCRCRLRVASYWHGLHPESRLSLSLTFCLRTPPTFTYLASDKASNEPC